jgi:hypothetical protein
MMEQDAASAGKLRKLALGRPGHRPGVTEAPCEELADGGPLRLGGPKKARPGAEMRTPRWRAERRRTL